MEADSSTFLHKHFFIHFLLLIIASCIIVSLNIDMQLEDYFYSLQGHSWAWKNKWLTEVLLHKGGRSLSVSMAILLVFLWGATFF
jgi:membrane-associated PAP2 superfamily phosphatase